MSAKNSPLLMEVFARVAQERARQRDLLLLGRINFDCASPIVSPDRKLRVLVEEVGEVAKAIDDLETVKSRIRLDNLRAELVQVAAVAVAWLESLEVKS